MAAVLRRRAVAQDQAQRWAAEANALAAALPFIGVERQ
jgi:hypothetical protein